MFKVTGIYVDENKSYPKTLYCSKFSDILFACTDSGIDLFDHFIKIEFIDFTVGQEEK